jgi:D-glycero-alpha-D-manno-heptose-7-phosphate kinase
MRDIIVRVPVRVDFAGGWTDVPKFSKIEPGLVVNAAITLYTYVTVKQLINSSAINIYSSDLDIYETAASVKEVEYNGSLDLAKAACKRYEVEGVEITIGTDAPVGSGLGTSASLGVALVYAISAFAGKRESNWRAADIAYRLETEDLELLSGLQDQYAATLGGINTFKCIDDTVYQVSGNLIRDAMFYELEKRLILCYTGKSRLSSDIHRKVYDNFDKGINTAAIEGLRRSGKLAAQAFYYRNFDTLIHAVDMSWTNQKKLHESITNEYIEDLFLIAKKNGMITGKACGAGGGGCLLFLANKDKEQLLKKVLKDVGSYIIDFKFDTDGIVTWRGV